MGGENDRMETEKKMENTHSDASDHDRIETATADMNGNSTNGAAGASKATIKTANTDKNSADDPLVDNGEAEGAYGFFTDDEDDKPKVAAPEVDDNGEAEGAYGFFTDDEDDEPKVAAPEVDDNGEAEGAYGFFTDDYDEDTDDVDAETLVLDGDLTIQQAQTLKQELLTAIASNRNLVINLASVSSVDLSFLQLLCSAHRSLIGAGQTLSIAKPVPPLIRQTMALSGFSGCAGAKDKSSIWKE